MESIPHFWTMYFGCLFGTLALMAPMWYLYYLLTPRWPVRASELVWHAAAAAVPVINILVFAATAYGVLVYGTIELCERLSRKLRNAFSGIGYKFNFKATVFPKAKRLREQAEGRGFITRIQK